jgi:hypothetical protein
VNCNFNIFQTIIFAALKKNRKYVLTMQLKGLVRFFALALILICLYQLSFTWMVRSYESSMRDKAELWVKAVYPTAEKSIQAIKHYRMFITIACRYSKNKDYNAC